MSNSAAYDHDVMADTLPTNDHHLDRVSCDHACMNGCMLMADGCAQSCTSGCVSAAISSGLPLTSILAFLQVLKSTADGLLHPSSVPLFRPPIAS